MVTGFYSSLRPLIPDIGIFHFFKNVNAITICKQLLKQHNFTIYLYIAAQVINVLLIIVNWMNKGLG